jgi:phosphoglucomutase
MDAIRAAGLTLGVDRSAGRRSVLGAINAIYKLHRRREPDDRPTFSFMTVDHDGKIRMDPSSPYAMARLVGLKDHFRVAFANDPDSDRHGIVTSSTGLMNPNTTSRWPSAICSAIGPAGRPTPRRQDAGQQQLIDRVVAKLGRRLHEVPVGFKWFVPGLFDGSCCFGGEESAGASFLRHDGTVWTTDKDGPIMDLLAARSRPARQGSRRALSGARGEFGASYYTRIDAAATPEQKARLQKLSAEAVKEETLAGERITAKLTRRRAMTPDRRPEDRDAGRVVRGSAVGDREYLQDLRGELPRYLAPGRARE